ncbi:MAG: A24 family peptidase [Anaerolineales bacterium]|nr:A24 family peptidase [Anaerolineales bacterium]
MWPVLLDITAGLLGLALGVIVNALADQLPPRDEGPPLPLRAPYCRSCGHLFPAAHWPALAHLLLAGGRCTHCGAGRGWRAPLVEAGSAIGAVGLWRWAGGEVGVFYAGVIVSFIFLLITVIDIEHRLVLWRVVWVSAIVLLLLGGLSPERGWQKTIIGGLVGYGMVFMMFLFGQAYMWVVARRRGQPLEEIAFGGGDVNLAGLVGLAVGWSGVLPAVVIGIFTAGMFSLGMLGVQLLRGRYNPHTPFAYGPFLALGGMAVYLCGRSIAAWWLGSP